MGLMEQATEARARAPASFEVYAHNWPVVATWCATWQQWLRGPGGERTGLDWAQVRAVLELDRTPRRQWPAILAGLRIMQSEALEAMASS